MWAKETLPITYYMIYSKSADKIIISDTSDFNIEHILDCGQVFRYLKTGDCYTLFAKDANCLLQSKDGCVIIKTKFVDFFVNYFDLDRDYKKIKSELVKFDELNEPIRFGSGIRLLNQDPLEMIISFIISANNNIPRIKMIIERLCKGLGQNMGDYYAFPTLNALQSADESFFKSIGAGYRAMYLVNASRQLKDFDLDYLKSLTTSDLRKKLVSLMGVGNKVADCIMLFAYKKTDLFPMDTWTKRVYTKMFNDKTVSADVMSKNLVGRFGDLSGYAQQYLYYYFRSLKLTY
ncbi:MAG: DNA-3-methyladenine glycosylase 2 family protein [Clostridiales bacterium]|nr:DNA-3-methyladenine glycosylase 2 family protein [Clostridiales bacterium]